MVTCGTLVKIWTLAVVIAALGCTGTVDGEKLVSCCKKVSRTEVADPITGYWIQNYNAPCVRAVIFETEKGLFCSYHKLPWVRRKIQQFEMARLSSTFLSLSSPTSLTSTSTPTTTSLTSSPPSLTSTSTSLTPSPSSSPPSLTSTSTSLTPSPSSSPPSLTSTSTSLTPSPSSSPPPLTSTPTFLPSSPLSVFSSLFPLSSSSPAVPSSPPSLSSSPSYLLSSLFPASSSPPSISSSPPSFSSPRHRESTKNASTQQSTSNQ
ncbi:uncharacterized protein LOC129858823 [Salvelinus fontinalis]|uniref:uncharacterized protein LOC129858823 n=1 Tax=Salvelinus fontinalis TaxID=8038 RepID=UPI0024863259|nr:uncharacterized protein LOC129858823 [Salvelinus fontinalis]